MALERRNKQHFLFWPHLSFLDQCDLIAFSSKSWCLYYLSLSLHNIVYLWIQGKFNSWKLKECDITSPCKGSPSTLGYVIGEYLMLVTVSPELLAMAWGKSRGVPNVGQWRCWSNICMWVAIISLLLWISKIRVNNASSSGIFSINCKPLRISS